MEIQQFASPDFWQTISLLGVVGGLLLFVALRKYPEDK